MSELWSDYYSVKKPRCLDCQQQQITENEYKFCSLERKPLTVYDERGKNVVHVFEEIYACNVYHWTLFQGQGKIEPKQTFNYSGLLPPISPENTEKSIDTNPISEVNQQ